MLTSFVVSLLLTPVHRFFLYINLALGERACKPHAGCCRRGNGTLGIGPGRDAISLPVWRLPPCHSVTLVYVCSRAHPAAQEPSSNQWGELMSLISTAKPRRPQRHAGWPGPSLHTTAAYVARHRKYIHKWECDNGDRSSLFAAVMSCGIKPLEDLHTMVLL